MYCCKGIKPIKEYIFNEMAKYGYINKGINKNPRSNKILKRNLFTKNKKVKRKNINYPPKKSVIKKLKVGKKYTVKISYLKHSIKRTVKVKK